MKISHEVIRKAILIRRTEETFLRLFSKGMLNGTVHTCIGQEFSALAFSGQLCKEDFVSSNHRCHGHYIAFTSDVRGLIYEIMGKKDGLCGGIGSSQHICKHRFFTNGIQGGMMPVSGGMALSCRYLDRPETIAAVFIGDGTLGEGVVYETLNLISKWSLPLLVICENNLYAQSTPQSDNLAGDILSRAEAFGIKTTHSNTWDVENLFSDAKSSIDHVRQSRVPIFHLVDTYRLAPHSKGDDNREPAEIQKYREIDPLFIFSRDHAETYKTLLREVDKEISDIVKEADTMPELDLKSYFEVPIRKPGSILKWQQAQVYDGRVNERINAFFHDSLRIKPEIVLFGEDIKDPYGGAFKVTRGLSDSYPNRVLGTPISEAAITGFANGMALAGMRPFVEIMFGDFITLAMDQIINHAAKFCYMYNHQVTCPIVVRTPMGGGRGYGPTHSQTLDKFLIGIDTVLVVSVNSLLDPYQLYTDVLEYTQGPAIVIENKLDYAHRFPASLMENYVCEVTTGPFPEVRMRPAISLPDMTIVTYGGMADLLVKALPRFFYELDIKAEVIVLSQLYPLRCQAILESVQTTGKLVVIEQGSPFAGLGAEILAQIIETGERPRMAIRIGALPLPIPSTKSLEQQVLPTEELIFSTIKDAIS